MRIVYIHVNPTDVGFPKHSQWSYEKIPDWVFKSIYQTKMLNPKDEIYLIANEKDICESDRKKIGRYFIHVDDIKKYYLRESVRDYLNNKFFQFGIEFFFITTLRFPILAEFMKDHGDGETMFLEGDVLTYYPYAAIRDIVVHPGKITCGGEVLPNELSAAIMFFGEGGVMKDISDFIVNEIKSGNIVNDMSGLKLYSDRTENVSTLPFLPNDGSSFIFDPLSWGQYLGGDNRLKKKGCIISKHKFATSFANSSTINITRSGIDYKLDFNGNKYSFYNIHVHNKDVIDEFLIWKEPHIYRGEDAGMIPMRRGRIATGLKKMISSLKPNGNMSLLEIGSYCGDSTSIFLESGMFGSIHAVDLWKNGYDTSDGASSSDMSVVEDVFDQLVHDSNGVIHKTKGNVEKFIQENKGLNIDVAYIDACHTYEGVKRDIETVVQQVKPRIAICGHDYGIEFEGVTRAVNEMFGKPDAVFEDSSWMVYAKDKNKYAYCYVVDESEKFNKYVLNSIRTIREIGKDGADIFVLTTSSNKYVTEYAGCYIVYIDNLISSFDMKKQPQSLRTELTTTCLYKLFIPYSQAFSQYERVVFFDADTEIFGNVTFLSSCDMGEHEVLCVREYQNTKQGIYDNVIKNAEWVELPKSREDYYNTGVIVFNLKKFRDKDKYRKRLKRLLVVNMLCNFTNSDQDVINLDFEIGEIPERFNYAYGKNGWRSASVVHYMSETKRVLDEKLNRQ